MTRETQCGQGTFLDTATSECRPLRFAPSSGDWSWITYASSWPIFPVIMALIFFALFWFKDREYVLETEVDAPLDELYFLLTDVNRIAEVHPHLAGISTVITEQHEANGAVIEWELETSAMWAPPWPLFFLKKLKTKEHVSTVATLTPGRHARIQNVGMKGYRGKLVPFYYLHWWDLTYVGPKKTKVVEYELLKGSSIKFLLGATEVTLNAHKQIQANLRQWAWDKFGETRT